MPRPWPKPWPTRSTVGPGKAPAGGAVATPRPRAASPDETGAIDTTGLLSLIAPVDPAKVASPKAKMPPSDATSQYPLPDGVEDIPTTGLLSFMLPVEPKNFASPKEKIPPSDATNQ